MKRTGRYGDLISLLERAREDVYFTQKDVELLARLKQPLANSQQVHLDRHTRNCSQCDTALHKSSFLDFAVDRCSGCDGIWVEAVVWQQFMNMKMMEPDVVYESSIQSLRNVWPPWPLSSHKQEPSPLIQ